MIPPRLAAVAVSLALVSACTRSADTGDGTSVEVTSDADSCTLSTSSAPSGTVTFTVTNAGNDVTEFYVLAAEDDAVVGEVENIGPGLTRDLVVEVDAGDYVASCKPGMTGDGLRSPFTVTAAASPNGS